MKTTSNKIRKTVLTVAFGLMMGLSASAQVFVLGEGNKRQGNVITHGLTEDQTNYVPVGSGSLLLAALAGAYLIGKKVSR